METDHHPVFRRPDGSELPASAFLDTHRGAFRVRATITQGPKLVGKRICVPLRTRDQVAAEWGRDLVIGTLAKLGFMTRDVVLTDELGIFEVDANFSTFGNSPAAGISHTTSATGELNSQKPTP
mgnify:CR=1 FL=1